MSLSSQYGLRGVNAPLPHQIAIKNLLLYFDKKLKKYPRYNVVSEMNVRVCTASAQFEKNADIVIWIPSTIQIERITEPIVIIEITRDSFTDNIEDTKNKDINKINDYFIKFSSLRECFLYNYIEKDTTKNTIHFIRTTKNKKLLVTKTLGDYKLKTLNISLPKSLL